MLKTVKPETEKIKKSAWYLFRIILLIARKVLMNTAIIYHMQKDKKWIPNINLKIYF